MADGLIIYATVGGTTRRVANRLAGMLDANGVHQASIAAGVLSESRPAFIVLLCPTYGDAELEESFEDLLATFDWTVLAGTPFAFCELGIYTGYEEFGHGLAAQVRRVLLPAGLRPLAPTLSLDSVPVTDWPMLERWAQLIRENLAVLE